MKKFFKNFSKRVKFVLRPIKEIRTKKRVRKNNYYYRQVKQQSILGDQVLLESYHAVSMTGNVYAIFTGLVAEHPELTFNWAYAIKDDPMIKNIKQDFPNAKINFIPYESNKYYQLLASCKYLINDTSFMPYFIKKDGQEYINTWHGTPLKTLGLDIKNAGRSEHKNIQRNLLHADKIIMPNKFTADRLIHSHDLDGILPGEVYVAGNARVDLTFSDSEAMKIKYNLPNKKIILFAPTWKKSLSNTTEEDIQELINQLDTIKESVGPEYAVLLKSHYFVYDLFVKAGLSDQILPNWIDTNELLSAVDILITDYSSIFFDYLPLNRPVYFYIPDEVEYAEKRGFYLDLNELPGLVSEDLNEIARTLNTDQTEYLQHYAEKYLAFKERFLPLDDGSARKRAVSIIMEDKSAEIQSINYKSDKIKILIYAGGFYNNGITNSIINLSNHMDMDKYELIFWDFASNNKDKIKNIEKVNPAAHFIYKFSYTARDLMDTFNQNWIYRQGADSKYANFDRFKQTANLELKRVLGDLKPDIAIDFGGYNKMFTALIGASNINKKVIYLHNAMYEEYQKKVGGKYKHKWNLKVIFSFYRMFDKLVSVSASVNEQNKVELANWIPDTSKMISVDNVVDGESILQQKEILAQKLADMRPSKFDGEERITYSSSLNDETGILTERSFIRPHKENINFINVARLSPEKNQLNLIRAFSIVYAEHPNARLYIVGGGPIKGELRSEIKNLDLTAAVFLMGYLEDPALLTYLSDCFILPSNYEGQGLSLIEAMIMDLPVIGTDVAGIHSVLEGTNGLLVPNTIEGIADGMNQFILGNIKQPMFDYVKYNEAALNQFYTRVVEG